MRISAVFLLPAEVLVTNSESYTPHFLFIFNSDYGSIWLSFPDMGIGQTDTRRQTNDSIAIRCQVAVIRGWSPNKTDVEAKYTKPVSG